MDQVAIVGKAPGSGIPDQFETLDPEYRSYRKTVRPGVDLMLPDAYLKWYDIAAEGVDLGRLGQEARAYLEGEHQAGRLRLQDRLGFLELHHCDAVAFLIVFTWNNNNEMWQSAWAKDLANDGPFERVTTQHHGHRPALCVWELAPVWHEREAWVRYMESRRDKNARREWQSDRFAGAC